MSESPGFGRRALGVLCCAAALAVYLAACGLFLYHFMRPIHDWVNRQDGIFGIVCAIAVGLGYMAVLAGVRLVAVAVWHAVAGPPGGSEPDPATPPDDAPRCPKCGFRDTWDGTRCGHCGYVGQPWNRRPKPAG